MQAVQSLSDPEVLLKKISKIMHYFEDGFFKAEVLFDDSNIMTIEVKQQLEKVIPNYITGLGWEMVYSRSRDGASFSKYVKL